MGFMIWFLYSTFAPFRFTASRDGTGWVPVGSRRNDKKLKKRLVFSKRRSSFTRRAARYTEKAVKRKCVTLGMARAVVGGKISGETRISNRS